MSLARWMILMFGPVPIIGASIALCDWLRSERGELAAANQVWVGHAHAAEPPTGAKPDRSLARECQRTARLLEPELGSDCELIVRPPFVIAGDLAADQLDRWHRETIGPAAQAMAARYFQRTPDAPITVLLFEGQSSYSRYAERLFGDRTVSVYGYYKPQHRTLVMNISTGGGTLVHELTHALADFDFPTIPDWFNEGLASLHEQCRFRQDETGPWIEGLENWRLPGLQAAVRKERVRSLKSLIEEDDFRGRLEGLNYAQARYFCLFMQRRGKLEAFYRQFHAAAPADPRGLKAVEAVFSGTSWEALDDEFRAWVLTLKRPATS